jgi:hypothetical protein
LDHRVWSLVLDGKFIYLSAADASTVALAVVYLARTVRDAGDHCPKRDLQRQ